VFTTPQDRQNMLDQLAITKLRPGRDSDPNSPNAANYDQAKANVCPKLPEILETKAGRKVTTANQWWKERRPEIVEMLEREVYGGIPENVPMVKWEVRETREIEAGGKPAMRRHIVDSHMKLALCTPRLTFISHGIPERGDAHWLDHQGSFMAAIAAGPVFRLLGARDLGRSDDYMKEKMSPRRKTCLTGDWR
jgi:hypothetical protein